MATWTRQAGRFAEIAFLVALAAGCTTVAAVERDSDNQDRIVKLNPFARVVEYEVDLSIVLGDVRRICIGRIEAPADEKIEPALRDLIVRSLAEHARSRFEDLDIEVAGGGVEHNALDAALSGCTHVLAAKLVAHGDFYTLLWSRRRLGLEVSLVGLADDKVMWTARHTASRTEMSLPTDPVGLVVAAFRTQDLADDAEVLPSLVDDVMRRLFSTFPAPQTAAN